MANSSPFGRRSGHSPSRAHPESLRASCASEPAGSLGAQGVAHVASGRGGGVVTGQAVEVGDPPRSATMRPMLVPRQATFALFEAGAPIGSSGLARAFAAGAGHSVGRARRGTLIRERSRQQAGRVVSPLHWSSSRGECPGGARESLRSGGRHHHRNASRQGSACVPGAVSRACGQRRGWRGSGGRWCRRVRLGS